MSGSFETPALSEFITLWICLFSQLTIHLTSSSLQNLISSSKVDYEHHLVSTYRSNPGKLFSHLKSLSKPASSDYPIFHNSEPVTDRQQTAQLFNSYFNSVFTVSDFILPPANQRPTPTEQLSHISIDSDDVADALQFLNTTKAPGTDDISPLILKLCSDSLLFPITHLLNTCMLSCSIPDEWKVHKIIPILKGSDTSDVQNYRPIFLLCILSKVLESIIYIKMIDFIRPFISKYQFGFLSNRSCLSQLLSSFSSYIVNSIEYKKPCDAVFLDFRKAFDTIPHPELLFKLRSHGITGSLWSWFQAYLSNCSHYPFVDGCSSNILPVKSGVPQGSVLGPLLFLIYVNDIPNVTTFCRPYLFADDTKFLETIYHHTSSKHLQEDLDSLATWCSNWRLSLNCSKCAALQFTLSSSTPTTYLIDGQPIKLVEKHKDLGILVQNRLSWSDHITSICAKAYRSLHVIRHSISSTSSNLRFSLYLSLVRSKLSYCSQLWRPRLIKDIICLERVQRRATKFVLNDVSTDYKSRLISLHLLPLMYWFELQDFMYLIKCMKDPSDNFDIYSHIPFVTSCTRASSTKTLKHNFCRYSTTQHFYFNRVVHLWNALPPVDITQSYPTIKRQITNFLWDHFTSNFTLTLHALFTLYTPVPPALTSLIHNFLIHYNVLQASPTMVLTLSISP